jgi:hypothetical protein
VNVLRLVAQGKPVVVYDQRGRVFRDVRTRQEFDKLTSTLGGTAARRFNEQAPAEGFAAFVAPQPGVRLIWVIDPRHLRAVVYRSLSDVRGLGADGQLDGEDVLPGFRCALSDIVS